ncbi:MAG: protein kinase [Proteobacteria bacterium]|nr:protein kinase [Pseudomonadota bacterium]
MKPVAFGNYTLLRGLTSGGMAELYLARVRGPTGAGRLAVVKLLSQHLADDPAMRDMFRDEVHIAATLHHPQIGQVYEVGTIGGQYFLALEYIHGRDLRAVVNACRLEGRSGLPAPIAVFIGTKVCAALQHAHEARGIDGRALGIVHRDVSPSNIMVTFDGDVKLVDFGIARLANRSAMTHPGYVKGKVRYLTPEQLLGRPVDHRADIFMLGISLWEATVGEHLFAGERENDVYRQICNGEVRRPTTIVRGYPAPLEAVVLRALAFDPEQRFASARELHAELVRVAERQRFTLSELRAAELMRVVFATEVEGWEEAQRRGVSLLDHLLETLPLEETQSDGPVDPPLTHVDQLTTAPPPSTAGPATRPRAQAPAGQAEGADLRRRTLLFGAKGSRLPFADAPPTSGRPASVALASRTTPGPASAGATRQPLRVSDDASVVVTAEGAAAVLSGAAPAPQPGESAGAATLIGARSSDFGGAAVDEHATLIDPQPLGLGATAWQPPAIASPATPAGDPLTTLTPERMRRVATGDWSNRPTLGDRRPGTHPYFRERKTPQSSVLLPSGAAGPGAQLPPRARIVATTIVVAGIALGAWSLLLLTRGEGGAGGGAGVKARSAKGRASLARVRLTSAPSGATVYSARDGVELGSTPLLLERATARGLQVELHHPGYEILVVTLRAESGAIHAELRPKGPRHPQGSSAPAPPRRSP